jgi:endo-1,4-beta-xylanase
LGRNKGAEQKMCEKRSSRGTRVRRPMSAFQALPHLAVQTALAILLVVPLLAGAGGQSTSTDDYGLKDAYKGSFLIGAALNRTQIEGGDSREMAIVNRNFNAISPENVLKWALVHPRPDHYDFEAADRYVEFGEKNHMFIVGHNLIWHKQTPAWVFRDSEGNLLSRDKLLERMRDHIGTVVGRYKGRINGWDVVNEAIAGDGTMRPSPWLKIIGDDYVAKAFEYAHEADPNAELYYNDYDLEKPAKRRGALELIKKLKAEGVPVTAVGLQNHDRLDWPSLEDEDATISAFADLGVNVNISELDVDVLPRPPEGQEAEVAATVSSQPQLNPYAGGLPDSVQQALAKRYAGLFGVFLKHRNVIGHVTVWGVTDTESWLNNYPVRGRTNYPLLFDRAGQPKPAFQAVIDAARDRARRE